MDSHKPLQIKNKIVKIRIKGIVVKIKYITIKNRHNLNAIENDDNENNNQRDYEVKRIFRNDIN